MNVNRTQDCGQLCERCGLDTPGPIFRVPPAIAAAKMRASTSTSAPVVTLAAQPNRHTRGVFRAPDNFDGLVTLRIFSCSGRMLAALQMPEHLEADGDALMHTLLAVLCPVSHGATCPADVHPPAVVQESRAVLSLHQGGQA